MPNTESIYETVFFSRQDDEVTAMKNWKSSIKNFAIRDLGLISWHNDDGGYWGNESQSINGIVSILRAHLEFSDSDITAS